MVLKWGVPKLNQALEAPGGDGFRYAETPAKTIGMGPGFIALNRGKKSVLLDLKKAEDAQTLRDLIAEADDPWITPAEASGFKTTPSYDDTVAWLRQLAGASPRLHLVSIGKSWQGRDIWTSGFAELYLFFEIF